MIFLRGEKRAFVWRNEKATAESGLRTLGKPLPISAETDSYHLF
jgi:hypothetical protein